MKFMWLAIIAALALPFGASAQKKAYIIGLVAKSQGNPVFQAARVGANDAAKELGAKHGVEIRIDWRTPNEEDAQKQAEAIEQLVLSGADGIAVSCSDANKVTDAINSAVKNGVPVATFDSDAPASTSCSMASACFCASSSFGVRQSILILILCFCPSSRAACSAPTRAAWKTGFPCDFATSPIT